MSTIKLGNHRMVLVKESFGSAERRVVRGHQGAVEPFVGVEQRRQHTLGIGAVKNRLAASGFRCREKIWPTYPIRGNPARAFVTLLSKTRVSVGMTPKPAWASRTATLSWAHR